MAIAAIGFILVYVSWHIRRESESGICDICRRPVHAETRTVGMEVTVYENNRREFNRTRVYPFDLKQPLDPDFYRRLKLKLYVLSSTHLR